jgi:hypothetical protein
LCLEQATTTVARFCPIEKCLPVVDQLARRREDLVRRADVHVTVLVEREVLPTVNLLNRAVYGAAFRRYGKRLRVLPVLEKGEVRASALRSWERGTSGRWHIHCAIELPSHFDAVVLERLIRDSWAKVEWGHGRILVRDGANAGSISYMLKDRQKSEFDGFADCIIIESLYNPIADA